MTPQPVPKDWHSYLDMPVPQLIEEYARVAQDLADCHGKIAFLKVEELSSGVDKRERILEEGDEKALTEEKFLLRLLIDHADLR